MKQFKRTVVALALLGLFGTAYAGLEEDLFEAINQKDEQRAKELVLQHANVNAKIDYKTPLFLAVYNNLPELTEFLLAQGADVKATNTPNHKTALHRVGERGPVALVSILVKYGADVNASDKYGNTPLYNAVYAERLDVVKELLKQKDIDVNKANDMDDTPLHAAVYLGNIDIIRLLLEKGADLEAKNAKGNTPLQEAQDPEIQQILKKAADKRQEKERQVTETRKTSQTIDYLKVELGKIRA